MASDNDDAAREAREEADRVAREAEKLREYNEEYLRKQRAHEDELRRLRDLNQPWE